MMNGVGGSGEDSSKKGVVMTSPLPYLSAEAGGKIVEIIPHTPPKFDVGDPKALLYVITSSSITSSSITSSSKKKK